MGTVAVVTDRAILEITEQGAALQSVHPGEDADEVLSATPFAVRVEEGGPAITPAPTEEDLQLIRSELDPLAWYTR